MILSWLGKKLAKYLSRPLKSDNRVSSCKPEQLVGAIQKGDVLLVEGTSRVSHGIKYITQSSWSHAALYISDEHDKKSNGGYLIEADLNEGVRKIPLSTYMNVHTRICRPVGLAAKDIDAIVAYVESKVGYHYDLKNIFDLARYLIQTPPVPSQYRRRLLALGSGEPTKAICSSLIAQAFQSVSYPILPDVIEASCDIESRQCRNEMLQIRHHSLFTPRDFDISPYFQIVKPTIQDGFDPYKLEFVKAESPQ